MHQRSFYLSRFMLVCVIILSVSDFPSRRHVSQITSQGVTEAPLSVTAPDEAVSQVNKSFGRVDLSQSFGKMPLIFIKNQGQMIKQVAYYLQGRDTSIYFTSTGLTFAMTLPAADSTTTGDDLSLDFFKNPKNLKMPPVKKSRWILKLDFMGANKNALPQGEDQAETVISYFKGSTDEWHTGLATFHRLIYHDLWPGIDLVYSGTENRLKYEFVVQSGADPDQILLAYRGASGLKLDSLGGLEISTPSGRLIDEAPLAYQVSGGIRKPVNASFSIRNHGQQSQATAVETIDKKVFAYSFQVSDYDPSLPLVIDPAVLIYCGYIGGIANDRGYDIAVDSSGSAYVTGNTISDQMTFPANAGPDLSFNGNSDAYVAKVLPDGSGLAYAGYIGGSGVDEGYGIAVDGSGAAYVAGRTTSDQTTFPVRGGPDLTYNGVEDAFLVKVRPDGQELVYAGYIGGNTNDGGFDITIDESGAAFVTGYAASSQATFPVRGGPDLTHNIGWDAFVAKVYPDGMGLVYAGYIGGSGNEIGNGIAVDKDGAAYITGFTLSSQPAFPVLGGPDLTYNGLEDAFVTKVKPDGTGLVYSGYVGGAGIDIGYDIAVDDRGAAYLTGRTESDQSTFPVSIGPDLSYNGGYNGDAFVAKVLPNGAGLVYAGYIGGESLDYTFGIAIDGNGAAYVAGWTGSDQSTFPVRGGPDLTFNGGGYGDAFVAEVRPDGADLVFAGYIGGSDSEVGYGIALDRFGLVYVAGDTLSDQATFPVIGGPDLTYNGGSNWGDAFVAKIGFVYQLFLPVIGK